MTLPETASSPSPISGAATRDEVERALAAAGAADDARFPLYEVALSCALHEDSARDAEPARAFVREAANRLSARLKQLPPEEAMGEAIGGDLGLSGDLFTYDLPLNADLIAVCERRRGLPVALGVIYLEAARRCRLEVSGVDFPGHFLLRVETGEGPMALDPFAGGHVVLPSDLVRRAMQAGLTTGAADNLEHLMAPISDRAVIMRLQNNLYVRASRAGDFAGAERSALRRALISPTDHRPWLDVASAREAQGRLAGALEALARAGAIDGGAALAARVQRERVRLQLN